MTNKIGVIYTTFGDIESAKSCIKKLLNEKLIACANIFPIVTSMYRDMDQDCETEEVVAILKTSAKLAEQVVKMLEIIHPYTTPCIIISAQDCNTGYYDWLCDSLG